MPNGAVGVLHRGGAEVDVGRGELLDQRAEGVGLREPRNLVAELEALEDVLHVGREPVEPGPEVGLEPLPARPGSQVTQGELRRVVERLPRRRPQGVVLLDHAGLVEHRLHVEHRLLGVLQHRVEPAQHGHREDDVTVLAADVQIAQDVVGNAPDVARDPVQVGVARRHRVRAVSCGAERQSPAVLPIVHGTRLGIDSGWPAPLHESPAATLPSPAGRRATRPSTSRSSTARSRRWRRGWTRPGACRRIVGETRGTAFTHPAVAVRSHGVCRPKRAPRAPGGRDPEGEKERRRPDERAT